MGRLGGSIHLKSQENIGTQFTIHLPIELENIELYASDNGIHYTLIEPYTIERIEEIDETDKGIPKVLIVDDNQDMCKYIKEVLEPVVKCTLSYNGYEAISMLEKEKFDLIISDLRMPIMNGFELKAEFNKLDQYRGTPFLMMSAFSIDYKTQERIEHGINEYIIKPFSELEITSRVKVLLEQSGIKDNLFDLNEERSTFNGDLTKFISKMNTIVLDNLKNSSFNVKMLATECGYSESKLFKILKSKTGLSPVQIILEIRLLKAYELIKNQTFQTINEVMHEIGISSGSYFRKVFSERFGVKPSEMTKKLKILDP